MCDWMPGNGIADTLGKYCGNHPNPTQKQNYKRGD